MTETQEQLRIERGNRYGEFNIQIGAVAAIIEAMVVVYLDKHNEPPPYTLLAEWHYLAIKLARIPASPEYRDSYDDLSVYSQLVADNNNAK